MIRSLFLTSCALALSACGSSTFSKNGGINGKPDVELANEQKATSTSESAAGENIGDRSTRKKGNEDSNASGKQKQIIVAGTIGGNPGDLDELFEKVQKIFPGQNKGVGTSPGNGTNVKIPSIGSFGGQPGNSGISSEASGCAAAHGVGIDQIFVSGADKVSELTEDSIVLIVAGGNHPDISLQLDPTSTVKKLAGICVVQFGNFGEVKLKLNLPVGMAWVSQVGNSNLTDINVGEAGALEQSKTRVVGNSGKLVIHGKGPLGCLGLDQKSVGNKITVQCGGE